MLAVPALFSFTDANTPNNPDPPKPTLVFPVAGLKAKIGSFWGAVRDGGKRKHEGIDIFAAKNTPVVAVTDGIISAVGNGGIGGKTVWLRSTGSKYSYYYAHLDTQLVRRGQRVKKGQILGRVGNTGNARNTPPHLHFGVYTSRGAVDPLPYVKGTKKMPIPPAAKKTTPAVKKKTTPAVKNKPVSKVKSK